MADSQNARVQILIAVIGLIGVITAAVIGNWDRIAGNKVASSSSTSNQIRSDINARHKDNGTGAKGQAEGDVMQIVSAVPPSGTPVPLPRGAEIDFQVRVEYRLVSLERASLIVNAVEFPSAAGGCNGTGRIISDDQARVSITRGNDIVVVSVPWYGDNPTLSPNPKLHTMSGLGTGFVGFRADIISEDQTHYQPGKVAEFCFRFGS